jgi:alpha-galactosidase
MTGPAALCCWTIDTRGLDLWADVRCGAVGVELGQRVLPVFTVTARPGATGETAFAAAVAFCKQMCPSPRLPAKPVYGFNDWYCNYGKISADTVRQETAYLVRLAPKAGNAPFMVIDDGWQRDKKGATGDWSRGNERFPDMAGLAADIRTAGARPGIWVRLLHALPQHPASWRLARDRRYLDPSVPEVRAYVVETVKRIRGWGYELIKHDFSTFDLSGRYGPKMDVRLCGDGDWGFADRSRTTAEIILDHYRSIREATGDGLVIGCDTVGHLAAGVFELNRIGDDTSGKEWSRTSNRGINTLAFRAAQHGAFFAVDADCVGQTEAGAIPWEKNRQWLDLLARSGTSLFVSFKLGSTDGEQDRAIAAALDAASRPLRLGEPLDWFDSLTPQRWRLEGRETTYRW